MTRASFLSRADQERVSPFMGNQEYFVALSCRHHARFNYMSLTIDRRSTNIVRGLIVVMAMMLAGTYALWSSALRQPGVDFYLYWGIAKAQRLADFRLGSPYVNRELYQGAFESMAYGSGDNRLASAVAARELPDPTSTPLAYYLMGKQPNNYGLALNCYRVVQVSAFLLAAWLFARPLKLGSATGVALMVALVAGYSPLAFDIGLGNVNCLQLLGFVATATLMESVLRDGSSLNWPWILLLTSLLVLQTLFKPNFAPAAALLSFCLLLNLKRQRVSVLASLAGMTALFLILPCALFGWSTWWDWAKFISSPNQVFEFSVSSGNYSGVGLIKSTLGVGTGVAESMVLLLVALPLIRPSPSMRETWARFLELASTVLRALREPGFAVSAGIVLSFAISPLIWQHYQLLAIAPALWLCGKKRPGGVTTLVVGCVSILLFADLPVNINTVFGGIPGWMISVHHGFSWMLLWFGMIAVVEFEASPDIPLALPKQNGS